MQDNTLALVGSNFSTEFLQMVGGERQLINDPGLYILGTSSLNL